MFAMYFYIPLHPERLHVLVQIWTIGCSLRNPEHW